MFGAEEAMVRYARRHACVCGVCVCVLAQSHMTATLVVAVLSSCFVVVSSAESNCVCLCCQWQLGHGDTNDQFQPRLVSSLQKQGIQHIQCGGKHTVCCDGTAFNNDMHKQTTASIDEEH